MGEFQYTPQDGTRHRAAKSAARSAPVPPSDSGGNFSRRAKTKNVEEVLSLGDVRYVTFMGRQYSCAPVPFKLGQRVVDVYEQVLDDVKLTAMYGKKETRDRYYKNLKVIAKLLWTHLRPTRTWRKVFRAVGLMRNPFLRGSESDLQQLTDFFLRGRTKSSVQHSSEMA